MILFFWGVGILSQICEIFESRYLEKYTLKHKISRGISAAQMDFVGGPALQNYNSRQRQPPSWIFAQTSITYVMWKAPTGNRSFDQNEQK